MRGKEGGKVRSGGGIESEGKEREREREYDEKPATKDNTQKCSQGGTRAGLEQ